jgi:probable phosphoglycerate mutase
MSRVRGWLAPFGARGRPAIAVTHKGVLRAMLADATGWDMLGRPPVKLAPGCVHRFEVDAMGRIRLGECNIPMFAATGSGGP